MSSRQYFSDSIIAIPAHELRGETINRRFCFAISRFVVVVFTLSTQINLNTAWRMSGGAGLANQIGGGRGFRS